MITPDQLTEENGFAPGMVVEVVWAPHNGKSDKEVAYWESVVEWSTMHMASIRPLTGPMSIWNHAPEWAVCAQVREMGVSWEHKVPEWWDGKSSVISMRPFWAEVKQ